MIAISKVQEELENVSKSVLNEVNDALDVLKNIKYSDTVLKNVDQLHIIEMNLRKILRIMSR